MIPILNLQSYLQGSTNEKQDFIQQLHHACSNVGFFYLNHHSISTYLLSTILQLTREFFHSPQAIKDQIDIQFSVCCRGYGKLEAEKTHNIGDYKETYDLGPERLLHPERVQKPYLRLLGPNQWPKSEALNQLHFKENIINYMAQMMQLGATIMQAMTAALQFPSDRFEYYFQPEQDDAHAMLRLLHYPATNNHQLGVGAHVDSGFIAFLLQDDVGGLQILSHDNQWIEVPPIANHFVVNIGEMLQSWSNGCYKATMHRVINQSHRARYSAPFFFEPNLSANITIPQLNNESVIYGNYLLKIFERSFPNATQR